VVVCPIAALLRIKKEVACPIVALLRIKKELLSPIFVPGSI
jgi:hypothetical protein